MHWCMCVCVHVCSRVNIIAFMEERRLCLPVCFVHSPRFVKCICDYWYCFIACSCFNQAARRKRQAHPIEFKYYFATQPKQCLRENLTSTFIPHRVRQPLWLHYVDLSHQSLLLSPSWGRRRPAWFHPGLAKYECMGMDNRISFTQHYQMKH